MQRRHDIDALRALAFGLLILYHLAMLYVTDWGWHLKSSYLTEALQMPMLMMNRWRMDLIFLISGISTAFLLQRSRVGELCARAQLAADAAADLWHAGRGADPALCPGCGQRPGGAGLHAVSGSLLHRLPPGPKRRLTAGSTATPGTTCGTWPTCGRTPCCWRCCSRC